MSTADCSSRLVTCDVVRLGSACNISAATAAASGAAAEVPKNAWKPGTDVWIPSGATKSTLPSGSGVAIGGAILIK